MTCPLEHTAHNASRRGVAALDGGGGQEYLAYQRGFLFIDPDPTISAVFLGRVTVAIRKLAGPQFPESSSMQAPSPSAARTSPERML